MSDSASSPTQPASGLPADRYIGQVIGERYRLLQRIGEGGMGAVYRAEHMLMKKVFALKLLHRELGQVAEAARRFEREAQSASRLSHPNIVAVTDFGRAATGELYLVMEHVPGQSLASLIESAKRLPVPRALGIVRQMLSALAHAHASGVVHRDLKPANVMLTRSADGTNEDNVKILDFGIAKLTQDLTEGERPLTQAAMVFGTPSYMSPEQATAQEVDARADVYSCGVMLYELLTGRKPFVAGDLVKIMAMQVTTPPPRFASAAPEVRIPAALEAAVMRALEKDRARRYQSAAEMAKALEGLETAVVPQALAAEAVSRARTAVLRARPIVASVLAELLAAYRRLPWKIRRFSPLFGVLMVVLVLVAVPSLCSSPSPVATAPPPPKPVVPALQEPLRKVEEAMARARLTEARVMLLQLLSRHPREARVHYLLGNLEFVDRKPSAALAAYDEALRLDPGLRGDAALLVNVRSLLEDRDRKVAWDALMLLADCIGAPAAADLAEMANDDRRPEFRAAAREACASVPCGKKLDLVRSYGLDLSTARTCDEKREAVRGLAATKDARAIEPLKKARAVRGAFGGLLGGGNDCVRKEIDAALKELGA